MPRDDRTDVLAFEAHGPHPRDCSDWVKRNCAVCRRLLDELARELTAARSCTVNGELSDADERYGRMLDTLTRYRAHAEV